MARQRHPTGGYSWRSRFDRNNGDDPDWSTKVQDVVTLYQGNKMSLAVTENSAKLIVWVLEKPRKCPHPMVRPFWPDVVREEIEIDLSLPELQEFVDFCLATKTVQPWPRPS